MKEVIDLLVLSDRYLPYAVGGAELSLHSVVSQVPKQYKVLVFSIYPFEYDKESYQYQGIDVKQLKPYARFPFQFLSQDEFDFLNNSKRDIIDFYEDLFLSRAVIKYELYDTISNKDKSFLLKQGIDEVVFGTACTIKQLKTIFDDYHIKTLHADNLRSIAFSRFIDADRKVFTIRDNRFHELDIKDDMSDARSISC